ncbi:MAG: hypothetical protein IPN20_13115 [Haliscomenobacter sp.]|nr:hypothetical protein [Haliscomenobacter sp.]
MNASISGLRGLLRRTCRGAAYWFSDLFLPDFYLATGQVEAARNLLLYRYRHLPYAQAIAERAGFSVEGRRFSHGYPRLFKAGFGGIGSLA